VGQAFHRESSALPALGSGHPVVARGQWVRGGWLSESRLPGGFHKHWISNGVVPRVNVRYEPGNGHRDPEFRPTTREFWTNNRPELVRFWRGGAGSPRPTADAPGLVVSFPFVLPCSALVSGGVYSSMGSL